MENFAYTNYVSQEGSFWHKFLLPSIDKDETLHRSYEFELVDGNFRMKLQRKSDGKEKEMPLTQEVNTLEGEVLAIGAKEVLHAGRSYEYTAKEIRNAGGLAVPVHGLTVGGLGEQAIREYAERGLIDALEWNSYLPFPLSRTNKKVEKLAEEYNLSLIANDDLHGWKGLGKSYTLYDCLFMDLPSIKTTIMQRYLKHVEIPRQVKKVRGSLLNVARHTISGMLFNPEK